jgi:hypothetical protein
VVVPRGLLAAGCTAWLRSLGRRFRAAARRALFPAPGAPAARAAAEIDVVPYAHTPTPQAALGLQALIGEAFGPKAAVRIAPTTGVRRRGQRVAAAPRAAAKPLCCCCAISPRRRRSRPTAASPASSPRACRPGAVFALVVDEAAFRPPLRRLEGSAAAAPCRMGRARHEARPAGRCSSISRQRLPRHVVAALLAAFTEAPKPPAVSTPAANG